MLRLHWCAHIPINFSTLFIFWTKEFFFARGFIDFPIGQFLLPTKHQPLFVVRLCFSFAPFESQWMSSKLHFLVSNLVLLCFAHMLIVCAFSGSITIIMFCAICSGPLAFGAKSIQILSSLSQFHIYSALHFRCKVVHKCTGIDSRQ